MPKITSVSNLTVQLTNESKPSPIPRTIDLTYTEKAMTDYAVVAPVANQACSMGTVSAPRFVLIEVTLGVVEFSWDSLGAAPTTLSANPTPQPNDPPATLIMFTFAAVAAQLYFTTTGPAQFKVWVFE